MGGARRAGNPAIELRLLGPLEVSSGGDTVALGGPKPRALLAVLALDPGHVVSAASALDRSAWVNAPEFARTGAALAAGWAPWLGLSGVALWGLKR